LIKNLPKKGSLHEDFAPAVNPPKEIDDPTDVKPSDWVDQEKIKDPEARKPDDWDEKASPTILDESAVKPASWCDDCPLQVPDPEAEKPDDWDDDMDGDWISPLVENPRCAEVGCGEWKPPSKANPAYKGKWVHPMIPNPAYKGLWKPQQIPNPDYFEDEQPHKLSPIGAIGIELWTMQEDIEFDNIFIDDSEDAASQFASATWAKKFAFEKAKSSSAEDTSFTASLTTYFNQAVEFAQENLPVVVAAVVGLLTFLGFLLYLCCCGGESRPAPSHGERKEHTEKKEGKHKKETKEKEASSPKEKEASSPKEKEASSSPKEKEASSPKEKSPKAKRRTPKTQ